MASWDRVLTVDLYGTALLIETLRPQVRRDTAVVCFASMAPLLRSHDGVPAADAAVDSPLDPAMASRLRAVLGPSAEDPGIAYSWAKRGVQRLVAREASWFGARGADLLGVAGHHRHPAGPAGGGGAPVDGDPRRADPARP
jgi:NAD(P)-dependent dehydrogenase (short-subunit alcohol dehydrogenase family)